jgi:4-hydroxy-3-polyprenylbenzoate decarboxylase
MYTLKKNAIWSFTVVGRPPQEDTAFGNMIHEMTGSAISTEIPGLHEVHAVDAAGVHPLLLAIGSERYTPYYDKQTATGIAHDCKSHFRNWTIKFGKIFIYCE